MNFGLEDYQEHSSFINAVSPVEATHDVHCEPPPSSPPLSFWNPISVMWDGDTFAGDYMAGFEPDYNFDTSDVNDQFNHNLSLDICQIPVATSGVYQSSSPDPEPPVIRARRTVLSVAQKTVLENWILDHADPYPTRQDKEELSQLTGLSIAQISSWFSRTRQRKLERVSYADARAKRAPEEAEGHLDSWVLPEKLLCGQGNWVNGGSLPSRPSSPVWNRLINRRSRSLPSRYTLRNIRYLVRNKSRVSYNEEISLNVIHSGANDQDSITSQLGAPLGAQFSFKRLGESPYFQQPTEHSKIVSIHRWLRDISNEFEAENRKTYGDANQIEAPPWPPASISLPSLSLEIISQVRAPGGGTSIPGEQPSGDALDSVSIPGSAGLSDASGGSLQLFGSYRSFGSRRGRRIEFYHGGATGALGSQANRKRESTEGEGQQHTKRQAGSTPARKYGCTFCDQSFELTHSWRRHEESVHAPQKRWVCTPPLNPKENLAQLCPVCDEPFVTDSSERQGCEHGFQACWEKPKGNRTFYRKDSLKQHISIVHTRKYRLGRPHRSLQLDDWTEVDVSTYDLRCYFCGRMNDDWHQRARHIISHFYDGETIDMWRKGKAGGLAYLIPTAPK
ncbi:hypothetical protein GGR58DRAFT_347546 [Xylaria digitata]|nr:hypothetical protein GGR58DRAFT_347546 [Xylaria digitata]